MFCTNCGNKLPDDARFCTRCGAPVTKVVPRSELEKAAAVEAAETPDGAAADEAASAVTGQPDVAAGEPVGEQAGIAIEQDSAPAETAAVRPDAADAPDEAPGIVVEDDGVAAADDDAAPAAGDREAEDEPATASVESPAEDESVELVPDEPEPAAPESEAVEPAQDEPEPAASVEQPDEQPDASEDPTAAADEASEDPTTLLELDTDANDEVTTVLSVGDTSDASESETSSMPVQASDEAALPNDDATTVLSEPVPNDDVTTVLPDADDVERATAAADAAAAESALWSAPGEDSATTVLPPTDGQGESTAAEAQQVSWQQPAAGASSPAGDAAEPTATAPAAPPQPEQPAKKKPIALIVCIVIVVVAAIVAACVFLVPRLLGSAAPTAVYGQTDPVQCSVVTRIRPLDENGNELTSYAVSLVKRTSDQKERLSADDALADAVAKIRVTGNNGFTMEDFGEDIADGDYYLVIEPTDSSNGSSERQEIPIHYEADNKEADDEISIAPPAPSTTDQGSDTKTDGGASDDADDADDEPTEEQKAYAAYFQKCQELVDAYGPAGTTDLYDGQVTAMTGLAVAQLIDFDDDGLDELLVSYATQVTDGNGNEALTDTSYPVEVWDYQDDELVQVYDGYAEYSNGGAFYLDLFEYDDQPVIRATWYDAQTDNPALTDTYTGYFAQVSDTLDAIGVEDAFFNYETGESSESYTLDGETATEDAWNDFIDGLDHTAHFDLVLFNSAIDADATTDDDYDALYGEDLVAATEDTLDELQEGAGPALDLVDANGTATSFDSELIEEDVTYTSSQGEGTEWEDTRAWCYPQFSCADGSTTSELDALNGQLKDAFDEDVESAHSWTFESGDIQVQLHRDTVTYLSGQIACVRSDRSLFTGGAHGNETVSGEFYDLTTGQQVDIETALGVPLDTLKSEAVNAVTAYVDAQPSGGTLAINDEATLEKSIDESRFYADEKGIVVALWPYEIGSYADGVQLVYVHSFGDDSIVGTSAGEFDGGFE